MNWQKEGFDLKVKFGYFILFGNFLKNCVMMINTLEMDLIELFKMSFSRAENGQVWPILFSSNGVLLKLIALPRSRYDLYESEQCSNRLQLDLISILINFSCELEHIMTRYDFLEARRVIFILVNFPCEFLQIMTRDMTSNRLG